MQVVNIANDQRILKDIEDKILYMLANASGNILDDEELIDALSQSKVTSKAINERLTEAEHTTKEINETREDYRCMQKQVYMYVCIMHVCMYYVRMYVCMHECMYTAAPLRYDSCTYVCIPHVGARDRT